jgi:hypothetical protein
MYHGAVGEWLSRQSAKLSYTGSNPVVASSSEVASENLAAVVYA